MLRPGSQILPAPGTRPAAGCEALGVAVLPRGAGRNVQRLDADLAEPLLDRQRDELGTVVAANVPRHPPRGDAVPQRRIAATIDDLRADGTQRRTGDRKTLHDFRNQVNPPQSLTRFYRKTGTVSTTQQARPLIDLPVSLRQRFDLHCMASLQLLVETALMQIRSSRH